MTNILLCHTIGYGCLPVIANYKRLLLIIMDFYGLLRIPMEVLLIINNYNALTLFIMYNMNYMDACGLLWITQG